MFIELTDHLRCPEEHAEAYLVLLPDRIRDRMVMEGELGCPVCGLTYPVRDGVADFGEGAGPPEVPSGLSAEAVHAFLGITGPGGYVALAGGAAGIAPELAPRVPGVHLVLVNPPGPVPPDLPASVLRAPRLPLRTASMRGVVLGGGLPEPWVRDAVRATLPGLRVVGEGDPPPLPELESLGRAPGVWVGRKVVTG